MNYYFWHLPHINEAGNGALLVMSVGLVSFLCAYLLRQWRYRPRWQDFSSFHNSYETRAAIGLTTFFAGFGLKEWSEWWFLHLQNHGMKPSYPLIMPAFVVGTAMGLWGMACLLAALSRYDWGSWRWIFIGLCAVAFGVVFAFL